MKFESLDTLRRVVEQGSYAAAAESSNLSPSAVSLQMKQLEVYFGQPLFDRSARQVRATAFARDLVETVRRAVGEIEGMRNRNSRAVAGKMRIGTIESAQIELVPTAFKALQRTAPSLEIQFVRGASANLLDELKAGKVDAAILVRPQSGGSRRLHWVSLRREAFFLVVPSDAADMTIKELFKTYGWIQLDRALLAGKLAARYVEEVAPHAKKLLELAGVEAIVAMAAAGAGISIVPKLRHELLRSYDVREIALGKHAPEREVALVCRGADADDRRVGAVAAALMDAVKERQSWANRMNNDF